MSSSKASTSSYNHEKGREASFEARGGARWPHPASFSVTPATLAAAGFYYSPSEGAEDSAACFTCGKQLGGWEESDDALEQHLSHTKNECPFARLRAIQTAREADEDWLDNEANAWMRDMHSAEAVALRKRTFEIQGYKWPYDRKKGWGPTSANLAIAGFSLQLLKPDDGDTAVCVYCGLYLSGWEKSDDPTEEHRRRDANCPFFSYGKRAAPAVKPASSAKASSSNKKKQRASRKTPAGASSNAAASETELESQPSRKRKTRGARSAAPSEDDEPAASQPLRQSKRGASSKVTASVSANSLADDEKPSKPARKPRGKKIKKSKEVEAEEEEPVEKELSPPPQPNFEIVVDVSAKPASSSSGKKRSPDVAVVVEQPETKKARSLISPEPAASVSSQEPLLDPVPVQEAAKEPPVAETAPAVDDAPLIDLASEMNVDEEPVAEPMTQPEVPQTAAPDSDEMMTIDAEALLPEETDRHGLTETERGLTVKEWYQRKANEAHNRLSQRLQAKLREFDEKATNARNAIVQIFRGGEAAA